MRAVTTPDAGPPRTPTRHRREVAAAALIVAGAVVTEAAALLASPLLGFGTAGVLMLAGGVLAGFTD